MSARMCFSNWDDVDDYYPVYCCLCAQLQFHDWRGRPCQFCGGTTFANVRPPPMFSAIDAKYLRTLDIPPEDAVVNRKPTR